MNKKITIYELIGLIKDGKVPKKVKYLGATYEYDGEDYYLEVCDDEEEACCSLFDRLQKFNSIKGLLTLTVEILPEENDEWEEMKEMDVGWLSETKPDNTLFLHLINLLIKNQKYIKEKLEDNTCIKTKTKLCNLIDERIEEKLESQRGPFMDEIRIDTPKWIEDSKKRKVGE